MTGFVLCRKIVEELVGGKFSYCGKPLPNPRLKDWQGKYSDVCEEHLRKEPVWPQ